MLAQGAQRWMELIRNQDCSGPIHDGWAPVVTGRNLVVDGGLVKD